MPNPYQAAIDALAGTINPENANRALDYVHGLPELVEAIANRMARDGNTYVMEFPTHPAAGEIAVKLGGQMNRMREPVEKFRDVFYKVHQKELDRLRSPRVNEQAWDVTMNSEVVR